MAQQVVMSAEMTCSFGASPSSLVVLPLNRTKVGGQIAATIQDHIPMVNILPFGLCDSPDNPEVQAAAMVPQACIPVTTQPWTPGAPTVKIGSQLALDNTSKCMCQWMGVITFTDAGQETTEIP